MSTRIVSSSLSGAWLNGLKYLAENGCEALNMMTVINDTALSSQDRLVVDTVNRYLIGANKRRVETVANTIFPSGLLIGSESRLQFYERYHNIYGRTRKAKGNHRGTYFGRLISYPGGPGEPENAGLNQIEEMIQKISRLREKPNTKMRFAYQMEIYAPERDMKVTRGFPCLSFVSLQIYHDHLCLTGTYRNQRYFERALGNFVGLAKLQKFIADEVGLPVGELTIHATHAEIEKEFCQRDTRTLIGECSAHLK